jgi:hypothetical protein
LQESPTYTESRLADNSQSHGFLYKTLLADSLRYFMQFAKDSFYLALRARLAALNPARVVNVNGVSRTALLVIENETPGSWLPDTFYLSWGSARAVEAFQSGIRPLLSLDCTISYCSKGSCQSAVDRGRVLGLLDAELFSICHPPSTPKLDFSKSPSADLGTNIFWSHPVVSDLVKASDPQARRDRTDFPFQHWAQLVVYFFPEADLP